MVLLLSTIVTYCIHLILYSYIPTPQPHPPSRLHPRCFTYLQQIYFVHACTQLYCIPVIHKRGFNTHVAFFLYTYHVMRIGLSLDHVILCSVSVGMEDIFVPIENEALYIPILQYILLQSVFGVILLTLSKASENVTLFIECIVTFVRQKL